MEKSLSVIIPAYNEEARVGRTLRHINSYLSERYPKFEIIVVDDGSADGTAEVAADFSKGSANVRLIKNDTNRGKGYSVRKGVLASSGGVVVFSDADESVPISELPKFIDAIEKGADVAIASRELSTSDIIKKQAAWRRTMGRVFNLFVRMAAFGGIPDTQCGFKCFKRDAALDLFREQRLEGFAFDVEILYLARLKRYRVEQIGVQWINSPNSRVGPIRDSMDMLRELFRIRRLHRDS